MNDPLKKKFQETSGSKRDELKSFIKENADAQIDTVKLSQVTGGMRGIKSMLWETSALDPQEGIRFRGYSIPQLREKLPKIEGGKEPLPEGLFWLMLVNELPSHEEVSWLSKEWANRAELPEETYNVLNSLPDGTHPMTQFSIGITSMQSTSVFAQRYAEGMNKSDYWDATYEDAMNLVARLPRLAAFIYRRNYYDNDHIEAREDLDWAANFAHMLGKENEDFKSLMRLYLTIHADHEGGNASAHTAHLVGSTLSDCYLSFASAINALAGPLHGLANQEVIKWIFEMTDELGTTEPSKDQIKDYVHKTLDEGKVVPGYGHAVLRQPDPRFTAQKVFAEANIKNDPIVKTVWNIFDVVPPILQSLGKVKNPWPNVDAHSGALLVHYGMDEYQFYTVLFGVSRALGVMASMCWSRALGLPLERPKSVTSDWLKEYIKS
ncbi:MAG: citrate (Si)-synthase [Saprospiraceae bacterium]|nr:citrate (Si)-synthase [Saprospiraceae bacterium]